MFHSAALQTPPGPLNVTPGTFGKALATDQHTRPHALSHELTSHSQTHICMQMCAISPNTRVLSCLCVVLGEIGVSPPAYRQSITPA